MELQESEGPFFKTVQLSLYCIMNMYCTNYAAIKDQIK